MGPSQGLETNNRATLFEGPTIAKISFHLSYIHRIQQRGIPGEGGRRVKQVLEFVHSSLCGQCRHNL